MSNGRLATRHSVREGRVKSVANGCWTGIEANSAVLTQVALPGVYWRQANPDLPLRRFYRRGLPVLRTQGAAPDDEQGAVVPRVWQLPGRFGVIAGRPTHEHVVPSLAGPLLAGVREKGRAARCTCRRAGDHARSEPRRPSTRHAVVSGWRHAGRVSYNAETCLHPTAGGKQPIRGGLRGDDAS